MPLAKAASPINTLAYRRRWPHASFFLRIEMTTSKLPQESIFNNVCNLLIFDTRGFANSGSPFRSWCWDKLYDIDEMVVSHMSLPYQFVTIDLGREWYMLLRNPQWLATTELPDLCSKWDRAILIHACLSCFLRFMEAQVFIQSILRAAAIHLTWPLSSSILMRIVRRGIKRRDRSFSWTFILFLVKTFSRSKKRTYNTGDSLVVTDPTTNPALLSFTNGERTGSGIL